MVVVSPRVYIYIFFYDPDMAELAIKNARKMQTSSHFPRLISLGPCRDMTIEPALVLPSLVRVKIAAQIAIGN